jgi:hypothetical protein
MPVWPFLMGIAALLTLWGWRVGAIAIPLLALVGYVGMRAVVQLPPAYIEVVGAAWWLVICALMLGKGGEIPAFFYALSALTYPVMLIFGFRMSYMGLSPIVAECFAALALLSIGGGIYGVASGSIGDRTGLVAWAASHSAGVAPRETSPDRADP